MVLVISSEGRSIIVQSLFSSLPKEPDGCTSLPQEKDPDGGPALLQEEKPAGGTTVSREEERDGATSLSREKATENVCGLWKRKCEEFRGGLWTLKTVTTATSSPGWESYDRASRRLAGATVHLACLHRYCLYRQSVLVGKAHTSVRGWRFDFLPRPPLPSFPLSLSRFRSYRSVVLQTVVRPAVKLLEKSLEE